MELYVFDINFNRLGVIDNYEEVEIERKYYKHSTLSLTVKANEENIKLLLADDYRILVKSTDLSRGYIVEIPQFEDGKSSFIEIKAYSLSIMTNWRIIQGQQRFKGNLESVIKGFVNANCINPSDLKRKIPNLVLGANTGINIITDEMYNNKPLDESLWEICEKFEVSYEILMNHDKKQFEFIVYQGADRSAEQSDNPQIIFAKAFDNVLKQSFVDDKSNYRSTAYVAGEGEGPERTVLKVNDNYSGLDRRELFIDARDLQSNFKDENGNEVSIPEAEYLAILQERGLNKLSEYQRIRTFESDIDNSQFKFGEDYYLGDKVTTRNDELGIITHARVVVAREKYNRKGYELKIEFGASIPTFVEKVKREIKNQSSSGGSSSSVVSEIEWNNIKDRPSTYPPSSHNHDDRYYTESEIDDKLKGYRNVIAFYETGGGKTDPNTTEHSYILTSHVNAPLSGAGFWHIQTFFYASVTDNRAQIAQSYTGEPRLYIRHFINGEWTNWVKLATIYQGYGSPEGIVTAPIASFYLDVSNGKFYIKTSGTGNTGWTAK